MTMPDNESRGLPGALTGTEVQVDRAHAVCLRDEAARQMRDGIGRATREGVRRARDARSGDVFELVAPEHLAKGLRDGTLRHATPARGDASVLIKNAKDGRIAGRSDLRDVSRTAVDVLGPAAWQALGLATQPGSEARSMMPVEDCIASNCMADYDRAAGDILDARIDKLAHRLPAAYRAIQAAAPKARVIVVDYPTLFPDAKPNCAALNRITPAEGDYLNRKVQRADIAILDAAHQAGVTGIDISTALNGGELTCSGTQYLNHANPQLKLLSGSFHPNAPG